MSSSFNVRLSNWYAAWENFSSSVRSGDILSAFIYITSKSNSFVGYVQGLNGIAQMLAALPAGVLTDRYRRDTMLRASALVGLVAGCFMAYTLVWQPTLRNICVAMVALGIYKGASTPALESIFADSVAPGRSSLYTARYIITILASGCGPLLSLALFCRLGNQWNASDCRHVLLWGLGVMVVPLGLMCFFDDSKALAHHHHHHHPRQGDEQGARTAAKIPSCQGPAAMEQQQQQPQQPQLGCGGEAERAAHAPSQRRSTGRCRGCWPGSRSIHPGLAVTLYISTSDLLGAFASGMTLKFFALFFIQVCDVAPATVSLLGVLSPLAMSVASAAALRASRRAGRVQVSLLTRACDVALLVLMAYLPTATPGERQLLMCVHLLRMALANCTRPLLRSVLMDAVPRRHRGKVNAVDSARTFSWSGSAALGGVLVERYGFQTTFLITSGLKLAAFVPLFFLLRYVHDGWLAGGRGPRAEGYSMLPENGAAAEEEARQEAAAAPRPAQQQAGAGGAQQREPPPQGGADGLREPLLAWRGADDGPGVEGKTQGSAQGRERSDAAV